MSSGNVVDSRVVELQFDNKDFESNAKTSMSTLEKLKKALNFKSESKGFDDVNSSIKRINLDSLTSGVLNLKRSFGQIAKEAFIFRTVGNLVDSVESKIVGLGKELTVGQVSSGWSKYAEKTTAVQTIMAATAKDFSDTAKQMEVVNQQLTKLNWFTDETSYSFIDMVGNIGKFTSNNVSLERSVTAMEGISTWAAISGANVQNASHAMYNLSQAIATGSVKLMDWKSIENANMATAEFKETALETAAALGTVTKQADGTFKTLAGHEVSVTNFNQQLSDGWFTSEVLLDTLSKYGGFTEKLYEVMDSVEGDITTSTMLQWVEDFKAGELDISKAAREAEMSTEDLKAALTELGDESLAFGMKAFKAAQEAKTFEEAIDATKDAVSTGWMNTFEILFGDYTQAKELWTTLANDMWDIFASGGEKRNDLLKEAFNTSSGITEEEWGKITKTGIASPAFIHAVRAAAAEHGGALEQIESDEAWLVAALNNGLIKIADLSTAFSNFGKSALNVDETLKAQVESAKESDEEFATLLSTLEQYGEGTIENVIFGNGQLEAGYEDLEHSMDAIIKKLGLSQEDAGKLVDVLKSLGYFGGETSKSFYELSNSELIALGYTEEQVKQLRLAQREGIAFEDVVERILHENHKTTGELWTETLFNGMEALVQLAGTLGDVWGEVFPETTSGQIVSFVETLHSGSEQLLDFIQNSEEFRTVLKGVFSVLDIGFGVVKTIGQAGFAAINGILEGLGINLVDLAAGISEYAISIHDWIMENEIFTKIVDTVSSTAKGAASTVKGWISSFLKIPVVSKNLERFKNAFSIAFKGFGSYMGEGVNRVQEFFGRVSQMDGLSIDNVKAAFVDFKENVLGYFANFPGFKALKGAVLGLWNDIKAWLEGMGVDVDGILEKFEAFGEGVKTAFGYVGTAAKAAWEFITNLFSSIGNSTFVQTNLQRFKSGFATFFDKIGPFFSGGKEKIDEFIAKVQEMGGLKLDNIGDVFQAFQDTVLSYFSDFDGFSGISEAFGGLRDDIKAKLSEMGLDVDGIQEKFTGFIETIKAKVEEIRNFLGFGKKRPEAAHGPGVVLGLDEEGLAETEEEVKTFGDKLSEVFGGIGDFLSGLDFKGLLGIAGAALAIKGLKDLATLVTSVVGTLSAAQAALKGVKYAAFAIAILAIAGAIKIVAGLKPEEFNQGLAAVGAIMFALTVFVGIAGKTGSKNIGKAGDAVLKMAAAVLAIVGAIWLVDQVVGSILSKEGGGKRLALDLGIIAGIIVAMGALAVVAGKFGGKNAQAAGVGMLSLAGSIILVIGAIKIIDSIKINNVLQVVIGLGVIIGVMIGVIAAINKVGGGPTGNLASAAIIASIGATFILLAAAMKIIASIPKNDLGRAVGTMVIMGVILGAIIFVSSKLKDVKVTNILMVVAIAVAIGTLGIAMAALTMVDQSKLRDVAISMGIVIAALSVFSGVTGKLKPAFSSILMLGVLLGAVAVALGILASLPNSDNILSIAEGLSLTLLALSGTLVILKAVGSGGVASLKAAGIGLLALIAFIAIFSLLGLALSALPSGVEDNIIKGLTTLKEICAAIGEVFVTIAEYVGRAVGALLGGGLEEGFSHLGKIGEYLAEFNEALQGIEGLSLDNLLGVLETLGVVLGASIIGFVDSILSLPSQLMQGKSAAQSLADDLMALATSLMMWDAAMTVIGDITIPEGLLATLATVLGANVIGFADSILSIPSQMMEGKSAAETVARDLEALSVSLLLWDTTMTAIGEITIPDGLDHIAAEILKISFVGLIDACTSAISQAITGKRSVELICEDIENLATALSTWQEKMEGIGEITIPTDAIGALIASIEAVSLTGLMSSIEQFVGNLLTDEDKSMVEKFAEETGTLATALGDWQTKMEEIGAITVPTETISSLTTALQELPGKSLIETIGAIFGADMGTRAEDFANDASALGTALQNFVDAFNVDMDAERLDDLVAAATKLAEVPALLKGTDFSDMAIFDEPVDYLVKGFNIINDAEVDVEKVGNLSTAASRVAYACSIFDGIDLSGSDMLDDGGIKSLITNIASLKVMIEQLVSLDTSGVDKFTGALSKINSADLSAAMKTLESSPASKIDMSASGSAMADSMAKGLGNSSAIGDAASKAANTAAKAIDTSSFRAQGIKLGGALANGISAASGTISSTVRTVCSSAASSAGGYYQSFSDVGYQFAKGLANGMSRGLITAMAAARALANSVYLAAKNALEVASPSKKGAWLGEMFDAGLINGLKSNASKVFLAGGDIGEAAQNGLARAIRGVNDIIHDNIDAQPVIRPVLDLTNIQNGSAAMAGLLNVSGPIGITGNLRAISYNTGLRSRSTNDDLLSALNDLGRTIGSSEGRGDTYVVNGITYDDGSNVSTAVKSLIRAAKVGRRS